jgi:small subunit ribosomal protein S5
MNNKAPNKNADKKEQENEFIDKLVSVNRTSKTVKGGRRFGFAALVVVGDGKGRVGYGKGKAKEVMDAKKKATDAARKNLIRVPMREARTLHHDVNARSGSGRVTLRSAPAGTGIIAGGPMRAVFEALGIKDIVAKSVGSSNPYNMVAGTFEALQMLQSPKTTAARRGKKVNEIVSQREGAGKEKSAEAKAE